MGHRISRVTTKTGDDGTTGLAGGLRVAKTDPCIEAIGAVDELNSVLGLVRTQPLAPDMDAVLEQTQHELFDLGALLAGSDPSRIGPQQIARLERLVTSCNAALPPLREFVLPGGSLTIAHLHVARTVCRRAERRVVAMSAPPEPARVYLNRLSDLLFVLARVAADANAVPEILWRTDDPS